MNKIYPCFMDMRYYGHHDDISSDEDKAFSVYEWECRYGMV